jgi:hypothetical protein
VTAATSDSTPVTLDAAEKLPIRSGRSACARSCAASTSRSIRPASSAGIATTSAADSRHGSSLEWCSYGPTNTTAPRRSPSTPMSLLTAPVQPEPQNTTRWSSVPPTARWMACRASSRNTVVCRAVAELSLCVFAYQGSTLVRITSSIGASARPVAVWSA